MRLEARKYLHDVRRSVALLRSFPDGKTLTDYEDDALLQSAVERQFEIIGEAVAGLARTDEATVGQIHDSRRIIEFRNVPIRGYADVDCRLVWDVIETSLPAGY